MTFTLSQLAKLSGATLQGDGGHLITSVADLESASISDISFLANKKYETQLGKTKAGAVCVAPEHATREGIHYLISSDPSRTFQMIVERFAKIRKATGFSGIHPTATIHETAEIAEEVTIGPHAVIDAHTKIGRGTQIGTHACVGIGVSIGKNCILHPHSVVREYCSLNDRVILQPGAVIGSCGFGYTTDANGQHTKLEQVGNVIIEDDVEIGANSTIDRARFKTTRIAKGTKIDNLVQIAHNVEIGEHNILCAQTGIAGTTKTGRNVMMGGQVGVVGHLEITDFVMIATRGGVSKTLKQSGKYAGSPVIPLSDYNRNQVQLRKIESYAKRIEELEKRLADLELITSS